MIAAQPWRGGDSTRRCRAVLGVTGRLDVDLAPAGLSLAGHSDAGTRLGEHRESVRPVMDRSRCTIRGVQFLPAARWASPAARLPSTAGWGPAKHYAITALWTAATYKIPLTIVVTSNAEYGILKQFGGIEHRRCPRPGPARARYRRHRRQLRRAGTRGTRHRRDRRALQIRD